MWWNEGNRPGLTMRKEGNGSSRRKKQNTGAFMVVFLFPRHNRLHARFCGAFHCHHSNQGTDPSTCPPCHHAASLTQCGGLVDGVPRRFAAVALDDGDAPALTHNGDVGCVHSHLLEVHACLHENDIPGLCPIDCVLRGTTAERAGQIHRRAW